MRGARYVRFRARAVIPTERNGNRKLFGHRQTVPDGRRFATSVATRADQPRPSSGNEFDDGFVLGEQETQLRGLLRRR